MTTKPIVYTLTTCPTCIKLKRAWRRQGVAYEERPVDADQGWLDEALRYGDAVPIVVWPDGRVEHGFEGEAG
ncbi:MAG: glutaredoxin family protein [Chloroflexi bacterium]|nr:glutaredoxin family protein [Chloroflexota bacterium]